MTLRLGASALLAASIVTAAACGYHVDRDRERGDGVHPGGFADEESADFHGPWLETHGYPLGDCRDCHGDDYAGGTVGVSCNGNGCHTEGVESCGTCHEATPTSGSHPAHGEACTTCHPAHTDARAIDHPNGTVDFAFSGLAVNDGAHPSFDPATHRCAGVYCHGGEPITWGTPGPLACTTCHDAPPDGHARFATSASDCASCHDAPEGHVDGVVELEPLGCDGCHGKGDLGAPPNGLMGATSGGAVGAHARHLDPTLVDRVGQVALCTDCHDVPETLDAPGHLDAEAPADVSLLLGGDYDAPTRGCVVACHWDRDPGPTWDDTSGAARACDGCHGFPMTKTRTGGPHPATDPDVEVCKSCHVLDPSTHVDGKVDFTW